MLLICHSICLPSSHDAAALMWPCAGVGCALPGGHYGLPRAPVRHLCQGVGFRVWVQPTCMLGPPWRGTGSVTSRVHAGVRRGCRFTLPCERGMQKEGIASITVCVLVRRHPPDHKTLQFTATEPVTMKGQWQVGMVLSTRCDSSASVRRRAQHLTVVECGMLAYRTVLATPVWYTYFKCTHSAGVLSTGCIGELHITQSM